TGNFLSPDAAGRLNVPVKKTIPYQLTVVDGTEIGYQNGIIDHSTIPTKTNIEGHCSDTQFDIVEMGSKEAILGMPWIREHNPDIDWKERKITFSRCSCVGKGADSELPVQYREFKDLFENPEDMRALPEHRPWDHEIKLKEGHDLRKQKLRPYNWRNLQLLEEYVKEGIRKGHIRKSDSPIASNMLIAKKKDDPKGRACVDYREVNNATVKDAYPLPTGQYLRDKLGRAKIFTKLDQRNAFGLIRIKPGDEWKTAFVLPSGLY
ncbi:hypothetical protein HYALB_00013707, partial [Hymenoscyphus albidus]